MPDFAQFLSAFRGIKRIGFRLALVVLTGVIACSRLSALEAVTNIDESLLPSDYSRLNFFLITVDVGNSVWDNFGHTALRVVDENSNTDTVYNWGLFDTSGGVVQFSFDFFKGVMNYQLGINSPQAEFAMYRRQQRTVWQDRINLTNAQKEILYTRLLWNLQPDNIIYSYDYFQDNCTTRVRDYLDEALSGQIRAATDGTTPNTFRDLVKYHYRSVPVIEFSLDLLMNSNIDRPVSEWEEMFLPLSLRARLAALPSDVAENGQRLPLLSEATMIMEFPTPGEAANPYYLAAGLVLLPVLFLFLMLRKVNMSYFATHSRITLYAPAFSFRLLGVVSLLVAVFSGIYGCLMLGGWFFSDHDDLYGNVNLLLCWPTDLLGILAGMRWLVVAKPWPLTHNSAPFINYYMLARLLSVVVYGIVAGLDLPAQQVDTLALTVGPGMFLLVLLIWLVGIQPARSKNVLL